MKRLLKRAGIFAGVLFATLIVLVIVSGSVSQDISYPSHDISEPSGQPDTQ